MPGDLDISALGPLVVRRGADAVEVRRPRCRALLAYLAARYPDGAGIETVADALWPGVDAERAANSVRVHASHLRTALAPDEVLARRSGDYRLGVEPGHLDVCRFEVGVARGRELAAAGDDEGAIGEFERAAAEWRGEPFAEFADHDAFRARRAALVALRHDLLTDYSGTLLELGWADEAVRVLRPVLEDHPREERIAANLMRALLRTGRRAEALEVHALVRAALRDAYGVAPGSELTELRDAAIADPDPTTRDTRFLAVPGGGARRNRGAMVGRIAELRELDAAWARARRGAPIVVRLTGVAGMGKTTLVEHFLGSLEDVDTLVGRCDPDFADRYEPFPDLVRRALRTGALADSPLDALAELAPLAPDLEAQLPPAGPAPDAATGRERLLAAVARVVTQALRPRVVVLEDLHWAGADAVAMLRAALRAASGQVLVVVTYREDKLPAEHPFAAALRSGRLSRPDVHVSLAPLTRAEVRAMVSQLTPPDVRRHRHRQVDELCAVTRGEPLRVVEVLHHLADHPDASIADIAPDDLRALVARRLGALPRPVSDVLRAAAVAGSEPDLDLVAHTADCDVDTALAAIERAVDEGLMVESAERLDRFAWTHPLYRNAVYHGTVGARRARLHLRAGQRLAAERRRGRADVTPASVARHHLAAGALADPADTYDHAVEAGADAVARYARRDAVEWFRVACDLPVATGAHVAARLALGRALVEAGARHEAEDELYAVAEHAEATGDRDLLIETVLALTPPVGPLERADRQRLQVVTAQALLAVDDDDPRRIGLLRTASLAHLYEHHGAAEPYWQEIERLTAGSTDPEQRALAWSLQHTRDEFNGVPNVALARRLRAHTRTHQLTALEAVSDRRLLNDLLRAGDLHEFDRMLAEAEQRAAETRSPFHLYWCAALAATRAMTRSSDEWVEDLVNGAAARGLQLEVGDARGVQMLQLFTLRYQQGRSREAIHGLEEPEPTEPQVLAGTSLLALTFATAGRVDAARAVLDCAVTDSEIILPRDNFRDAAVALFGGVAAAVGRPRQRRLLRRALESMHVTMCLFGSGGAVFGTPHHWLAELAAAEGDATGARDHLGTAIELCDTAGATYWADRARQALRDLGGRAVDDHDARRDAAQEDRS